MKKLLASLLFVSLLVPATASAADFSGIYIAPKIIGGIQTGRANVYNQDGRVPEFAKSFNKGVFGGGLALGYNFAKKMDVPLRLELEYTAFTQASASKTFVDTPDVLRVNYKSSVQSLFVNAYFDINTGTSFTPYVGAGLGLGFNHFSTNASANGVREATLGSHTSTNFAWNIGLGVAYNFNENVAVDLGYRYAQFGKGKTRVLYAAGDKAQAKSGTIAMHQFVLALRYTF